MHNVFHCTQYQTPQGSTQTTSSLNVLAKKKKGKYKHCLKVWKLVPSQDKPNQMVCGAARHGMESWTRTIKLRTRTIKLLCYPCHILVVDVTVVYTWYYFVSWKSKIYHQLFSWDRVNANDEWLSPDNTNLPYHDFKVNFLS